MSLFKSTAHLSLGQRGEKAAQKYLKQLGYAIIATNFCNKSGRRLGEIDIVAKDGQEFVFVEVKTRMASSSSSKFDQVLPEESISPLKLHKINKAAHFYLKTNRLANVPFRFDAITLLVNPGLTAAKLKHLKNIFF